MSHQSKLTSKRSNEEVKLNGRKKTKLKIHIVTCGSKYNDYGDVPEDSEVNYKMMYEALKKDNLWSLSV